MSKNIRLFLIGCGVAMLACGAIAGVVDGTIKLLLKRANPKTLKTIGIFGNTIAKPALLIAAGASAVEIKNYLNDGDAAYTLMFDLDRSFSSSVTWADWLSGPDLFAVIQVEGMGQWILPSKIDNYSGGHVLWSFIMPKIPRGREINVLIYDDDSVSNEIWNNILKTRWSYTVRLKGGNALEGITQTETASTTWTKGIAFDVSAKGDIQLLQEGQKVLLDSQDLICHYTVKVPLLYVGNWDSEGDITDGKGVKVGKMHFSQVRSK